MTHRCRSALVLSAVAPCALLAAGALSVLSATAAAQTGTTELISGLLTGPGTAGMASQIAISAGGRHVAFCSHSDPLAPNDHNGFQDVFLRYLDSQLTRMVSVSVDGFAGNGQSGSPSVSADGRFVAFSSPATDLVAGDTNGRQDIFVRDMLLGETTRVSMGWDGSQADNHSTECSISGDGRYVAFESRAANLVPGDTNGTQDVFVVDLLLGTTTRASVADDGSEGNGISSDPVISLDGMRVAFSSYADMLVPGDTNRQWDIFVHDLPTGQTLRGSVGQGGVQSAAGGSAPALSADGRIVGFHSWEPTLVPGDTNDTADVFVHDFVTGITERVNVGPDGEQSNLNSFPGSQLYDERWLSADGRFVGFATKSWTLLPGDMNARIDVFVKDRLSGLLEIVSAAHDGAPSNGDSEDFSMSADGLVVAFGSVGDALISPMPPPTLSSPYGYVRDRRPWIGLGDALAGTAGSPDLFASGSLQEGAPGLLLLRGAKPNTLAYLLVAAPGAPAPFKGGTLWASPALAFVPRLTDGSGQVLLQFTWPAGVPSGLRLRMQDVIPDAAAAAGFALSDAVEALVP